MKKLLISSLLLMLTFSLAPIISHAEKDTNCSYAGIQCQGTYMEWGDKTAGTNFIYFTKGSVIDWGVNNNYASKGQFQVEVSLWRYNPSGPSSKLESHIVPFGRAATFHYGVQTEGNYMVIVTSGDSSQGRSYAYGWLQQ
ncbi:hypothetical protein RCG19_13015 [Neobacillus sp. OS1-2]|uniref:hypothetical protein n=1 Tax=Neobacillus sp. OS1-2 TaxID=3070680 RepID=UPI0027E1302A|nr:hypothetical protein [Neobacillus sp. OS1-2]WML38146.1 hypothetical protein RCG19_13015 [Neobacillus sp. OS1-2]